jgi:hypothetical protein
MQYLMFKCHAKILLTQQAQAETSSKMEIDTETAATKHVVFDNLYDLVFNAAGEPKRSADAKLTLQGDHLDFLKNGASNMTFGEAGAEKPFYDIGKAKIGKQFKILNPVPKFQSVPATPQFFDLAGSTLTYPSHEEAVAKYKAQGGAGGLLSKMTGGWFGN